MPAHSRKTILLATDQQNSVLNALHADGPHPLAYTPYGHRPIRNGLLSLLGFNGELRDPLTGHYHLGNGYRPFSPVLMCFISPDSWSPFGKGGLNAYAYCSGDPINRNDPTGHFYEVFKWLHVASFQKLPRPLPMAPPLPPRKTPPLAPKGVRSAQLPKSRATPSTPPPLPPRHKPVTAASLPVMQPSHTKPPRGLPKDSYLASKDMLVVPSMNDIDHWWFIPVPETRQSVEQLIQQGVKPPPITRGDNINYAFEPDIQEMSSNIRQQQNSHKH
ncbi:TPA: RHS repeat-associated core domain-containing protein [Pseudomonas putida]|nr:RHS repeat-associated core domain-containing protein [Pseudomonas putida]